jgi:hypothetical protein
MGLAWLFGLGLIEMWYRRNWRKWCVRFGLCSLVTLINPFGWHLWVSTARALTASRAGFPEWTHVSWIAYPFSNFAYKALLLTVLVTFAVQLYRLGWLKIERKIVIIISAFIALSMTSARHTSFFAAVVAALLPDLLPQEPTIESISNRFRRLGYMALCAAVFLMPLFSALRVFPGDGLKLRYIDNVYPVKALNYLLQQNIRGNLLVPFNYGSFAMWEMRGRMRVSIDGRYDLVYRPQTYIRVRDFFFARGNWQSLLTTPAPDAILVSTADSVYPKLQAESGWREAYHDDTNAVFLPR